MDLTPTAKKSSDFPPQKDTASNGSKTNEMRVLISKECNFDTIFIN